MTRKFVIGIDLGGTNIKIGLLSLQGKILRRRAFSTKAFTGRKRLINGIVKAVQGLLREEGLNYRSVVGLGMGVPGPVDNERGIVYFLPNIPGWKNVALRQILKRRLRIPVSLDNDVNLVTLAEWQRGAGKGSRNMVCITLGTGVGGGLVIDNKLYRGESFAAGEIGHIPLSEHGPRCNCGGRACLERSVGNTYILHKARQQLRDPKLTLEELSFRARKGNRPARTIWRDVGRQIGVTLTGIVNVLNPARIVIGGGVSAAGAVLFGAIKETIKKRAMPQQAKTVRIVRGRLGSDAGIVGAYLLAVDANKQ